MAIAKKKKVTKKKAIINNPLGVKFDKDIEVPGKQSGFHGKVRATLQMMSIGESFLYEVTSKSDDKVFQNSINMVRTIEKKYESGREYLTRKVKGGRRVWRIV